MTKAAEQILADAMKLEPREAIEVAEMLLDSLRNPEHEKLWDEEIRRREEDLDAGRTQTVAWEIVREEMRRTIEKYRNADRT